MLNHILTDKKWSHLSWLLIIYFIQLFVVYTILEQVGAGWAKEYFLIGIGLYSCYEAVMRGGYNIHFRRRLRGPFSINMAFVQEYLWWKRLTGLIYLGLLVYVIAYLARSL